MSMIGRTYLLTTEADPRDRLGLGIRTRLDTLRRVRHDPADTGSDRVHP